jgi:hypothetical protein
MSTVCAITTPHSIPSNHASGNLSDTVAAPQPLTVVPIKKEDLSRLLKSGFFKGMKPCVYSPASNTVQLINL